MLDHLGYFTIRDVYTDANVGLSTLEKSKIKSDDMETPTETKETTSNADAVLDVRSNAKFFIALLAIAFLVNKFGK